MFQQLVNPFLVTCWQGGEIEVDDSRVRVVGDGEGTS